MSCFYCEKNETLNQLMTRICTLKVSEVYLVKNQNFPGRCVVAFKDHKTEWFQLTEEERNDFGRDMAVVAEAIYCLFEADKLNYAIYGDGVPHLHCHIIPKKKGGYCWGSAFDMSGNRTELSEEEFQARIDLIYNYIKGLE